MANSAKNPFATVVLETRLSQSLLGLLAQEQVLLIESDIERLTQVTEEKTLTTSQLGTLTAERYEALSTCGFPASEEGMKQWLDSADGSHARTAWKELLLIVQSAKEMNRTNGLLINRHLLRNQSALSALQISPRTENFYGPDGQSTARPTSRGYIVG